jgi:hypothetical protein
VFRFRFEAVGSNLKVQKPYIITKVPLKLNLKKPVKAEGLVWILMNHVSFAKGF